MLRRPHLALECALDLFEHGPVVREGRRKRWITDSLAPLRDVLGLSADEARAMTQWATATLLEAVLGES